MTKGSKRDSFISILSISVQDYSGETSSHKYSEQTDKIRDKRVSTFRVFSKDYDNRNFNLDCFKMGFNGSY